MDCQDDCNDCMPALCSRIILTQIQVPEPDAAALYLAGKELSDVVHVRFQAPSALCSRELI